MLDFQAVAHISPLALLDFQSSDQFFLTTTPAGIYNIFLQLKYEESKSEKFNI